MTYQLNLKAHYAPYGKHAELITGKDLSKLHITVQDDATSTGFDVDLQDAVFNLSDYKYYKHGAFYDAGGYQSAKSAYNFQHDPMRLWETQLNFAIHCSTSGLGVSTKHLNSKQLLVRSLYRFHVYYQVRRILRRMLVPTPSEDGFNKYNNTYSLEEVRRIGNEYGCSTKSLGLYKNLYYFDRTGRPGDYTYEHNDWSRWIINESHGFTKAGLDKISESIRVYSYLVLTSQASARHGILGVDAQAIAAQRLFVDNLEDVINVGVSIQNDIARYQSVLKYARSSLDYSLGKGLYMMPSDMLLKPLNQVIEGYNDKLVVNTKDLELGWQKPILPVQSKPHVQLRKPSLNKPRRLHTLEDHKDERQAVILSMVILSLLIFW